jgi:hypothetical protein
MIKNTKFFITFEVWYMDMCCNFVPSPFLKYKSNLDSNMLKNKILSSLFVRPSHDSQCPEMNSFEFIYFLPNLIFFLFSLFEAASYHVAQAVLKLVILLPLPPECWGYRYSRYVQPILPQFS